MTPSTILVRVHHRNGRLLERHALDTHRFTVGRHGDCEVRLRGFGIQSRHCQIRREQGLWIAEPIGTATCHLNGERLSGPSPVLDTDLLQIGSYQLSLLQGNVPTAIADSEQPDSPVATAPGPSVAGSTGPHDDLSRPVILPEPPPNPPQVVHRAPTVEQECLPVAVTPASTPQDPQLLSWRSRLLRELTRYIDLRRVRLDDLQEDELRDRMQAWIHEILTALGGLPPGLDGEALTRETIDEAIGLGPLEALLRDDTVTEIMVNSPVEIWFERQGRLARTTACFSDQRAVLTAIERIVAPLGRRIDESSPMVDARLRDGSRVNAVIPPLALKGPSITIRKFSKTPLKGADLIRYGSLDARMLQFLEQVVAHRQNLVISGGTGSGKTTLLNLLAGFIPAGERVITVEDAAELQLPQPNLVALEARPANQEGRGAVTIRDLVRNCLRMRPDRIVVGECRGGEALDMLQAMNTGHDGSLTTAHANSPRDCISRLEVMVMMSGMDLPILAIREQIASAVHFIIQQTRFPCGSRKVTSIAEVNGLDNGVVQLSEIFRFRQAGYDSQGRVTGVFEATGLIPDFCEQQRRQGHTVNLSIFQEEGHHVG